MSHTESKIFAIITDPGKGGTFLNWSLHFLAGHRKYFSASNKQWVKIPASPLQQNLNAHNFTPNQPINTQQYFLLTQSLQEPTSQFHSIYFHNFDPRQTTDNDMFNAVDHVHNISQKTILVYNAKRNCLYDQKYQGRVLMSEFENWDQQHEHFVNSFFSKDSQIWKDQNLNEIWDKREFLALNLRPFESQSISQYFKPTMNYYSLDAEDLWTCFDETVKDLFAWLEIDIVEHRYKKWIKIYQEWKKFHSSRLRFCWYFDKIIQNIVQGTSMNLDRFDLDLVQEAVIQHVLIYKYNLNLKTWGLEKFHNTLQLHSLLEKNSHTLNYQGITFTPTDTD